mgnify:CR=1 FL=1
MREQREKPQDKTPHSDVGMPDIDQIEIESVDDILAELEQMKKEENKRCGCWG